MMIRAAAVMGLLGMLLGFPAAGEDVSFGPGVSFTGAPSYVSEYAARFRDNGGPLSPFGSHVGLKAEVRNLGFAGVEHYACATGRIVYDYARTGRALTSAVSFLEESADFGSFQARARIGSRLGARRLT
jgi:hypothetical protein